MTIRYARMEARDWEVDVVLVGEELLTGDLARANEELDRLEDFFGDSPVVLLSDDKRGTTTTYGPREAVRMMADLTAEEIPWETISTESKAA